MKEKKNICRKNIARYVMRKWGNADFDSIALFAKKADIQGGFV